MTIDITPLMTATLSLLSTLWVTISVLERYRRGRMPERTARLVGTGVVLTAGVSTTVFVLDLARTTTDVALVMLGALGAALMLAGVILTLAEVRR